MAHPADPTRTVHKSESNVATIIDTTSQAVIL